MVIMNRQKGNKSLEATIDDIKKYHPEFILTHENESVLKEVIDGRKNILLSGNAGTGKSYLLKLLNDSRIYDNSVAICTPTGISASVYNGGVTIHKLFGFGIDLLNINQIVGRLDSLKNWNETKYYMLKKIQFLIIDEVSMVSSALLEMVEMALQVLNDNDLPFGGVRVLLTGDYLQLAPVVKGGSSEEKAMLHQHHGFCFFHSQAFKNAPFEFFELTRVFRQEDEKYISNLNQLRLKAEDISYLNYFNKRVISEQEFYDEADFLYLCSYNRKAEEINNLQLSILDTKEEFFKARTSGKADLKQTRVVETLVLKIGCQVVITANDLFGKYFNGSQGTYLGYKSFEDNTGNYIEYLRIELQNGEEVNVIRNEWQFFDSVYSEKEKKIVKTEIGRVSQFPILLGYAISIHSSQGMTLDRAYINLGRSAFANGLTYVALSRVKTYAGVGLARELKEDDIKVCSQTKHFYVTLLNEGIEKAQEIEWKSFGKENLRRVSNRSVS